MYAFERSEKGKEFYMKYIKKFIFIFTILLIALANNVFATSETLSIEELKNYLIKYFEEEQDEALKSVQIQENKIEIVLKNDYIINVYYNNENQIIVEQEFNNSSSATDVKLGIFGLTEIPFASFEAYAKKNGINKVKANAYTDEHGGYACLLIAGLEEDMKPNVVDYLDNYWDDEVINEFNNDNDFYTINYSKEKSEDKIIIKSDLIIKNNADFDQFKSDLVIKIKIGETYKIESDKEFNGYSLHGNGYWDGKKLLDIIELDYESGTITGLNGGFVTGKLLYGDNGEFITFDVEVLEDENTTSTETDEEVEVETTIDEKENEKKDETVAKEQVMPKTGRKIILYSPIILLIVVGIIACKKYKKLQI